MRSFGLRKIDVDGSCAGRIVRTSSRVASNADDVPPSPSPLRENCADMPQQPGPLVRIEMSHGAILQGRSPGPHDSSTMPLRRPISAARARTAAAARAALLLLGSACAAASSGNPATPAAAGSARPRLGVILVVDQFREPYLERYGDLFTGGFRRLLDQGRLYTRAAHDHAVTETAVGHATLSTGVYPMRHGIVANEWSERTTKGLVEVSNV